MARALPRIACAALTLLAGACAERMLPHASGRTAPPTAPSATSTSRATPTREADSLLVADSHVEEVFADPDRLAKLRATFPKIDAAVLAAKARMKVPGLGVGIVIDGAL